LCFPRFAKNVAHAQSTGSERSTTHRRTSCVFCVSRVSAVCPSWKTRAARTVSVSWLRQKLPADVPLVCGNGRHSVRVRPRSRLQGTLKNGSTRSSIPTKELRGWTPRPSRSQKHWLAMLHKRRQRHFRTSWSRCHSMTVVCVAEASTPLHCSPARSQNIQRAALSPTYCFATATHPLKPISAETPDARMSEVHFRARETLPTTYGS
jgi:hypothetical protein